MRRRTALRALLSHWRRSPMQLFTLIAGLALATALWSGVQAINAEARASYARAADQTEQGRAARIVAPAQTPLTTQDYVALRRAGWPVTPQVDVTLGSVQITGIDPLTLPDTQTGFAALPSFDLGGFVGASGTIIAGPDLAQDLAALGLAYEINPQMTGRSAFVDIARAIQLKQSGDVLDRLIVTGPLPIGAPPLGNIAPHLEQITPQGSGDIARLTDSFHLNLTAFGLLSFAVGLFIVYGAIGLAFEQRRAMHRTLRALGLPLRTLMGLIAAELLLLAFLAGSIGIALGYLIAAALLPDVAATLRGLYGADLQGSVQLRASWWLSGLAMALIGTALAAAGTFWRLSRLPLLDAGTPQAWSRIARRMMVVMALAGLALLLLSAVMSTNASSLIQGFVLLGSLLIGAALLLPVLLDRLLGLLERVSPPPLQAWFWADTRSQIPGLSMALMALLLAVAANIGVSTMVSSFRLTFTGWLDQRLAAEVYVTTADAAQAAQMRALIAGQTDAILPIVSANTRLAGETAEVYAIADHSTYRDNWPLLSAAPDVWDRLQTQGTALINEQLALRSGLKVGDRVPEANGDEIVGIYSDYGNPLPQMMIGLAPFVTRYPDVTPTRFGLRVDPAKTGEIIRQLRQELNLGPEAVADQARIKRLSLDIFEQTFTVTAALNVLTLSVAAFSILMSLLTLSQMRLPQLAPIWALGVTRRQLGKMELLRAVALAGLVTLLAVPLGLALAWVLLSVVNVAAFGWRLPMFLFPAAYGWLALAALVAALIAASWPAWRLARTAPHRLLQVFSAGR